MEQHYDAGSDAASVNSAPGGHVLIVDDDPVVAGMLGFTLAAVGHDVVEMSSGEAALTHLTQRIDQNDQLPDVVFLDIEMPGGIDGYETCRRLRAIDALQHVPVIFLSSHDRLEDRLRAYDVGGSDFIAKPFVPEEVLHKAALSVSHNVRLNTTANEKRFSFDAAMTALTSLGESGVTQNFSRGALNCRTQYALASLVIESMASFGLDCNVQIRVPDETLTLTPHGAASPLEESVIEKSREMGRIFSFNNRTIINYDNVSVLITNMPVADDSLCGRIRDHAAIIAEAAEKAADNVHLRTETVRRAEELRMLADEGRNAVQDVRVSYRDLQIATRIELENMTHAIEGMFIQLGLTNSQEFTISNTVRTAVDQALTLLDLGSKLDNKFDTIVDGLTKASEYTVSLEEDAPPTVELW